MNSLQIKFFLVIFKNILLYANMGNTHNSEKRRKLSTSQLVMVHHEKDCTPYLLYHMGWAKTISRCCPFKRGVLLISLGFVYNYEY
jgi:hypothetical protein